MLDRVRAGERGAHSFRAVFFSGSEGFCSAQGAAAEQELARRLSASASAHCVLSFVIADSRLLAPASKARALFPQKLIERIIAGGGAVSSQASSTPCRAAAPGWNWAKLRAHAKGVWSGFRKSLQRVR